MKKLLIAVIVLLLVWNTFLTYNLFSKPKDNISSESKITVLNGILTNLTELIDVSKAKIVLVKSFSNEMNFREGSGIVYKQVDNTIYIVTSNFILNGNNEATVTLDSGESFSASLVGADEFSDIAVISFNADINVENFEISNTSVKPGEYVVALGAKNFQNTVSFGVVNGFNNLMGVDVNDDNVIDWKFSIIQSEVNINSENNGGALVNINGELVGINLNRLSSEYKNISLNVSELVSIADKIISQGTIERQYLDLQVKEVKSLTTYEKSFYGLNLDITDGVYISEIGEDSPFYQAGLRVNDVIVGYNNEDILNIFEYNNFIYDLKSQDVFKISYYRNSELREVEVGL